MKKRVLALVATVVLAVSCLAGCGATNTLEAKYTKEQIRELEKSTVTNSLFSDVDVKVKGNKMNIVFKYAPAYDELAVQMLEDKAEMDELFDAQAEVLMEEIRDMGVEGEIAITFAYKSSKGKELYEYTVNG